MYDKPDAPSNFTLKLRKHLRTRRVEDVRQLGVDRVVDFVFGTGENAHHLILEMYAQVGLFAGGWGGAGGGCGRCGAWG
jgi:predicted ribosome quality control (RQC) complex YloA/Tae2 family protein